MTTDLDLPSQNNSDAHDRTVSHYLLQPRIAPFTFDVRHKIARKLRGSLCGFLNGSTKMSATQKMLKD
jgi:hypothetical protein